MLMSATAKSSNTIQQQGLHFRFSAAMASLTFGQINFASSRVPGADIDDDDDGTQTCSEKR